MMTADEAWSHIRERLSPKERLHFDRGQDITIEMTREEYDAIEQDPIRRAIREGVKRAGRSIGQALDSAILGDTAQPRAAWSPMIAPPLPLRSDLLLDSCEHAFAAKTCPNHGPVRDTDVLTLHRGR